MSIKIIFILPNIYESVNGVSTKYIKFINYISKIYHVSLFTTFIKNENFIKLNEFNSFNKNLNIIKTNGLSVPFYNEIKIPIINEKKLKDEIKNNNEIIIFNGEFIWIYDLLINIKKKYKNIKIYPTMHTDYLFYAEKIYKMYNFTGTLNYLDHYLEKKNFDGIIVTGDKMKDKYNNFTENIFNANEIDLDIFNNTKIDIYNNDEIYNIFFCGRISKEKNIEELLDCCLEIYDKYNFILNIIGDGPFLLNLKDIIEIDYKKIKNKIIFHGNKEQYELNNLYQSLNNRIFLFTSMSETFGKTPMEAGATGIPIFIKKSDITDFLYINKKNAFIFNDKIHFYELFEYFISLDVLEKQIFITNSVNNIKKYDQNVIFQDWINFLINGNLNKDKPKKINLLDIFTFHGISKFINCSGSILGD
jgi:glycosyltransferase involved in cell wall biosynthesis